MSLIQKNIVSTSFKLLEKKDKFKLLLILLFQIFLGFLDLVGVALVGILGALSVTGIQAKTPGNRVSMFLHYAHLQNLNFQNQVAIIGLLSAMFMICKTLLSMFFTKKSLAFLALRSANFSGQLSQRIFSQDYSQIKSRSNQENLFSLTAGANSLILGILGAVVTVLSDFVLILVMFAGLLIIEPSIAIGSMIFFTVVGFALHKFLSSTAQELGKENAILSVRSNEIIVDALDTFRELFVRNSLNTKIKEIVNSRNKIALLTSRISLQPFISKYVLEISLVAGTFIIASYQFVSSDAGRAIGNLALFLAAGSRVAPAILRIQQGFLQVKVSSGAAIPTINLFESLHNAQSPENKSNFDKQNFKFRAEVELEDVNFKYPGSREYTIKNLNLHIKSGSMVAIVGKSGAGKSTLADLILGVTTPQSGKIKISGMDPKKAIQNWPGIVSYVPQDVSIVGTSVSKNISLISENEFEDKTKVLESLKTAQLYEFVMNLPNKEGTEVGDRGAKLSGGQRQRIGIARALYTSPQLIILDEATSALDSETEDALNKSIQSLRGKVTLIVIAHRLATVRNADLVCYLENGETRAVGTFSEIRQRVPDFDTQAKLLGL